MKPSTILSFTGILILAALAAYIIKMPSPPAPNPSPSPTAPSVAPSQAAGMHVESPAPNAVVSTPLEIRGNATGGWYSEGQFPVTLLDASGTQIARGIAKASGEWMTEAASAFTATLTFEAPASNEGTLVLEKDNPSGLPENAGLSKIPVRFR